MNKAFLIIISIFIGLAVLACAAVTIYVCFAVSIITGVVSIVSWLLAVAIFCTVIILKRKRLNAGKD